MSAATIKVVPGYLALSGGLDEPPPYFIQYGQTASVTGSFYTGPATYTDGSGAITTGSTAQTLFAANTARKGFYIQNLSTTASLFFNQTGSAAVTTGAGASLTLLPLGYYESPQSGATDAVISINGPVTAQRFAAAQW